MSIAVLATDYVTNCAASTSVRFDRKATRNRQLIYLRNVRQHAKKPTAQMAHLVFAETQPNAEKPKEPFLPTH